MALDLTAANVNISIVIPPLFTTPQRIQGFATDQVFTVPEIAPTETVMGVDGILSGGMVFVPIDTEFHLQANSPSVAIFDTWYLQQVAAETAYQASGTIIAPSLKKLWNVSNGFLVGYRPVPDARKILQPQPFRIRWNISAPQPTS